MIINSETNNNCPFCKSSRISKVGNVDYRVPILYSTIEINLTEIPELWSCKNCYSSFVQNRVPHMQAISLYSQGEAAQRWSQEPFEKNKPVKQIESIQKYCKPGSKVLDVGCNTGELLDYLKSLRCETFGVEYSLTSRALIQKKGHRAFQSISDISDKFDVITAFDLVEHLYDVPSFFNSCKKLLKDNGFLIILTGDIECLSAKLTGSKWWYVQYPEHICFPSRKFFDKYSGLQPVEFIGTYASKHYVCSWLKTLKIMIRNLFFINESYSGLPSLGPDHVFVVLKNEK